MGNVRYKTMSPRTQRWTKKQQRSFARKRIDTLYHLAEKAALQGQTTRADRYVQLARRIGMRYLVRTPKEFKHLFCKHCYHFLLPGVTCQVRIQKGHKTILCHHCKRYIRIPYKPKKE